VRYDGWYRTVNRGKRRKAPKEEEGSSPSEDGSEVASVAANHAREDGLCSGLLLRRAKGVRRASADGAAHYRT